MSVPPQAHHHFGSCRNFGLPQVHTFGGGGNISKDKISMAYIQKYLISHPTAGLS
jgi:hypothetical protein